MDVPVVLMLVADHGGYLSHGVSARVVDAGHKFVNAEWFIYGGCELGAKLRPVIGQHDGWTSPENDVSVHQDNGGAFCCGDSNVRAAAEAISEIEDVRIFSGRG